MKILIIGSGIIGVTTAYEFIKAGYEVIVIDRQIESALETSYGNTGLLAPEHSYVGKNPAIIGNIYKSIFHKQNTLRIKFNLDINFWIWGFKFLQACTKRKILNNNLRKYKLSKYSQKCLHRLLDEINIEFHHNKNGLIYLFRSKKSYLEWKNKLSMLKEINSLQLLNKNELLQLEPTFQNTEGNIFGGVYSLSDESGSCRDFTLELTEKCKRMGVKFYFNTEVKDFYIVKNKIIGIKTNTYNFSANKYIIACASYSSFLAKKAGDYLPIYPVKGYSITTPIINNNMVPLHNGIDEDNLLAFSVMGDKIRFSSVAEISNYEINYKPKDFSKIVYFASKLFPRMCDYSNVDYWCGLRPMTPNGFPIIGKSKMKNLYYNTGHGHLGWTMCAGSAKIIYDIIVGNKPDIEIESLVSGL